MTGYWQRSALRPPRDPGRDAAAGHYGNCGQRLNTFGILAEPHLPESYGCATGAALAWRH
jgi:hypothetical protein